MSRKTCFIIGNGRLSLDLSARIDAADYVLRFNDPPVIQGWSGLKTDGLMLCNSGKPMQLKLADPQFLRSPFLQAASEVILAYHPAIIRRFFKRPLITSYLLHGRKRDWSWETIEKLGSLGKRITILPPQSYLQSCAELDIEGEELKKTFPSTGYLGISHMLQQCPPEIWSVTLAGFSWQGWKRHAWQREEAWIRERIKSGQLSLIESTRC